MPLPENRSLPGPVLEGVRRFRRDEHPRRDQLFKKLASGQEPKVLFITCSDSRIAPHLITASEPGDIFVIRNAGNLVPPYGQVPGGEQATVEYAVAVLKVEHIVVCGHSDCGAMKGLLAPESLTTVPGVAGWLNLARGTREAVNAIHANASKGERLARTIEMNATMQLDNLRSHPSVAAAIAAGTLSLHAWVYDIGSGAISAADQTQHTFTEINGSEKTSAAS